MSPYREHCCRFFCHTRASHRVVFLLGHYTSSCLDMLYPLDLTCAGSTSAPKSSSASENPNPSHPFWCCSQSLLIRSVSAPIVAAPTRSTILANQPFTTCTSPAVSIIGLCTPSATLCERASAREVGCMAFADQSRKWRQGHMTRLGCHRISIA